MSGWATTTPSGRISPWPWPPRPPGSPRRPRPAGTAWPADISALLPDRAGEDWISRKVGGNGVVCVSWQQVSVGKHHAGARCDVHVGKDLLQFWVGSELLKTVPRDSNGEVRKKNAARV